jgi:hypothetical protein
MGIRPKLYEEGVIVTAFKVLGEKLSRKRGYCDSFQGAEPKAVKKTWLL